MKEMYSVQELAEKFGVTEHTISRWARAGKIPALRLAGKLWRFPKEEVDRWLESQRNVKPETVLGE